MHYSERGEVCPGRQRCERVLHLNPEARPSEAATRRTVSRKGGGGGGGPQRGERRRTEGHFGCAMARPKDVPAARCSVSVERLGREMGRGGEINLRAGAETISSTRGLVKQICVCVGVWVRACVRVCVRI